MCLLRIFVSFLGIKHTWPFMAGIFSQCSSSLPRGGERSLRVDVPLFLCRYDSAAVVSWAEQHLRLGNVHKTSNMHDRRGTSPKCCPQGVLVGVASGWRDLGRECNSTLAVLLWVSVGEHWILHGGLWDALANLPVMLVWGEKNLYMGPELRSQRLQ